MTTNVLNASRVDLRFRCELDEETLSLLPRERVRSTPPILASNLELNPGLYVQHGSELPPQVAAVYDCADGSNIQHAFLDQYPIIWVQDPQWKTVTPLWCGGTWGDDLRRVVIEGASPESLPESAVRALHLAGVLIPRGTPRDARPFPIERHGLPNEHGIAVFRDLFSPVFLASLRRHFRRVRSLDYFSVAESKSARGRAGMYCDPVTIFVQHQLTRAVSHWVGQQVTPSYTWVMTYFPGAVLERHLDRPQSRWNVSFCVDIDPELDRAQAWPFYIQGPADTTHKTTLGIGDAALYSGTDQVHWRDTLDGDSLHTMGLFFYVDPDFEGQLNPKLEDQMG